MTPEITPAHIRIHYHWLVKAIVCASIIINIAFTVGPLSARPLDATVIFIGTVVIGGLTLAAMIYSSIEVDSETVDVKYPFLHFRIRWDEVQIIETDNQGLGWTLVFHGQNKRLVVFTAFTDAGKQGLHSLIGGQIQQRQIRVKHSAFFSLSNKNTKVGTRSFT